MLLLPLTFINKSKSTHHCLYARSCLQLLSPSFCRRNHTGFCLTQEFCSVRFPTSLLLSSVNKLFLISAAFSWPTLLAFSIKYLRTSHLKAHWQSHKRMLSGKLRIISVFGQETSNFDRMDPLLFLGDKLILERDRFFYWGTISKSIELGRIKAAVQRKWTTQKDEHWSPPKTDGLKETHIYKFLHSCSPHKSKCVLYL